VRSHRRKSDGLFLFMTKKQKLRALNRFREALNEKNQSKMYEYYLFYDVQMDQILLHLEFNLWKEGYYIIDNIFELVRKLNLLKSNGIVLIERHSLTIELDSIIDSVENEND